MNGYGDSTLTLLSAEFAVACRNLDLAENERDTVGEMLDRLLQVHASEATLVEADRLYERLVTAAEEAAFGRELARARVQSRLAELERPVRV